MSSIEHKHDGARPQSPSENTDNLDWMINGFVTQAAERHIRLWTYVTTHDWTAVEGDRS